MGEGEEERGEGWGKERKRGGKGGGRRGRGGTRGHSISRINRVLQRAKTISR